MKEILIIKKLIRQPRILRDLFKERNPPTQGGETPENVFYEPAKLLKHLGLNNVLEREPFKNIRTAGRVWEFYLLRVIEPGRRDYNYLIKPVFSKPAPFKGCTRAKLGNPYDKWLKNYPDISTGELGKRILGRAAKSFAKKLMSRKCPVRQKGTSDFYKKRKHAAKRFFAYLINGTVNRNLYSELRDCDTSQGILAKLIIKYPRNNLFLASGLMICLYGGKNENLIDSNLAKAVNRNLKSLNDSEYKKKTLQILKVESKQNSFKPPFQDIYDAMGGNRERVNINFRIQTWLKLLEDTLNANQKINKQK